MKIITVFRSGGDFTWSHVDRIRSQCVEHAPGVDFVCLSDDSRGEPLRHDWPGWWAKMEMFRYRGPCLYLDLDTTVCGDLRPLLNAARSHEFLTLRDFNWPQREVQSSVMGWSGDMIRLYDAFAADPARHMAENAEPRWWGDQGFIERNADPAFFQDVCPGALVSWKKHCAGGVPVGVRAIVFHGRPRPWEVEQ